MSIISSKKEISEDLLLKEYAQTLKDIRNRIKEAQVKSILSVNKELLKLYWYIGETITEKQKISNWGTKVIEQLANDLQSSFPGMSGFSKRNVFRMRAFFLAYQKVPQAVAQLDNLPIFNIPWGHNAILLENRSSFLSYKTKMLCSS